MLAGPFHWLVITDFSYRAEDDSSSVMWKGQDGMGKEIQVIHTAFTRTCVSRALKRLITKDEVLDFVFPLCSSRKYQYSPHRRDWNFLGGGGRGLGKIPSVGWYRYYLELHIHENGRTGFWSYV